MAGDLTWVYLGVVRPLYFFTLSIVQLGVVTIKKSESDECRLSGLLRDKKVLSKQGSLKVTHIVFIDISGIVNSPIPLVNLLNGDYYERFLHDNALAQH